MMYLLKNMNKHIKLHLSKFLSEYSIPFLLNPYQQGEGRFTYNNDNNKNIGYIFTEIEL